LQTAGHVVSGAIAGGLGIGIAGFADANAPQPDAAFLSRHG